MTGARFANERDRSAVSVRIGRRNVVEGGGVIFELNRHVLQRLRMLAGVMSTKQQSAPGWQHRAQVRASTTPVASISGRQGSWGQYGSHVHVLLIGVVLSHATTTPPQNFPRRR